MNLKNRINDLFQKYSVKLEVAEGEIPAEVVVDEPAVASAVLSNGTTVYVDAPTFEVGLGVYVLNEEGEKIPLPDGEYELEGGGALSILEGVIASYTEAVVEEEVAVEAKTQEEEEEEEAKKKEKMYRAKRRLNRRSKRSKLSTKSKSKRTRRSSDYKSVGLAKHKFNKISKENTILKAELAMLKKTSASTPLARKAKKQKNEKIDLSSMSTKERIFNLHNLYK
tara:strand:+ start:268 stop:939 length:672 start_codon:yes stop_codon:yes gene_type:complete